MLQFDKSMNKALTDRVKNQFTFKVFNSDLNVAWNLGDLMVLVFASMFGHQSAKLRAYRYCDNVWTFLLNDVEFCDIREVTACKSVKIVACDGRRNAPSPGSIPNYSTIKICRFIYLYTYIYVFGLFCLSPEARNEDFDE